MYDDMPIHSLEAYWKCRQHINAYKDILVSISGGADSDVMLDLIIRHCKDNDIPLTRVHFVFFDTGIEYEATKRHLTYLEKKYDIEIHRIRALEPVPLGCKLHGQPFLSKFTSSMIERLQSKGFDFASEGYLSYETLLAKYPKSKGALTWWCNKYLNKKGKKSHFNINNNLLLKEFMIENPPKFKISAKCCKGAKKDVSAKYEDEHRIDLKCTGIRKAEGGIRSSAYKSCFNTGKDVDLFMPIFWLTDKDKAEYVNWAEIQHSDCYSIYGYKRTGCAGCPFNSQFETDLKTMQIYEPRLYLAVNNIFGQSYAYTRAYRQFRDKYKNACIGQMSFDEVKEQL